MRIVGDIVNSLFGTAQRVTAQIVIAVPTSLCVAYVTNACFPPAPPAIEAKVEAPAPTLDKTNRIALAATAMSAPAAETAPVGEITIASADASSGLTGTPLEADFDADAPRPGPFIRLVGASRNTVDTTVDRVGTTLGNIGDSAARLAHIR